jgi:hypothetical protein
VSCIDTERCSNAREQDDDDDDDDDNNERERAKRREKKYYYLCENDSFFLSMLEFSTYLMGGGVDASTVSI